MHPSFWWYKIICLLERYHYIECVIGTFVALGNQYLGTIYGKLLQHVMWVIHPEHVVR